MTPVTPCRGRPAVYDAAVHPHTPAERRLKARTIAAALCSSCPIAGTCPDRIPQPSTRFKRKAAMNVLPNPPVPEQRPEPQLVPTPPAEPSTAPLSTEQLIVWGANHNSARYQTLAGKASAALADLRKAYEQAGKVAEAEARIKRLRAQLANAERDLAAAKGKPAKPTTKAASASAVDYAAVRAWAARQGIEVAPVGRPRRDVVNAYLAAQQAA
jgi:hypothetical protein